MNSPRVAHIVRKWNVLEWGGTETYVASVTSALARAGWTSEVHAPSCESDSLASGLEPSVALSRFAAHNPYVASRARRAALTAIGGNLFTLDEPVRLARSTGISLAHLHTGGRIGGAVRFAMKHTQRAYVLSVHGPLLSDPALVAHETETRRGRALDLGAPVGALLGARRVLDDAAAVLCFNERERRSLEARLGSRVHQMDHGVDLSRFHGADASRADARWPALRGRRVWLVLGRLSRQKNQQLAVRAFAASGDRDGVLVLAGAETDAGYRASVEELARSLGVAQRVIVLGNVPRNDVVDLLARCYAVLVPSTHEAFGLVVLEGWAARKPVLFADCVGLCDLRAPLVDPRPCIAADDPRAWASAIDALAADPALGRAWGAEGRALCERRYSWKVVADRLIEVYQRAIDGVARERAA